MSDTVSIGPYRVIKPIGSGGQGRVFLGYDERLSRRVAIKLHDAPQRRDQRRAVLREARLVAHIQSARVVQIHDIITSRGHLAMVMEYVPGTDLEQVLRHTRCSVPSAIAVGSDVAAGLAATRQQRIVHGDLKAANVLVTTRGRLKLTDFGIARHAQPSGADAASVSAISPEHLLEQPLDVRSDLFCLGCLLYRMLSGEHPFVAGGRLLPELMLGSGPRPLAAAVPPAMALPPGLETLIHSMLERDPRDRPANTHEVRRALRAIDRELPLSSSNALQREAQALFRNEPPPRRAPAIPVELQRAGRSRLGPSATEHPWSWHNPRARPRLAAVAVIGLAGLGIAAYVAWEYWLGLPTRVHFDAPEVRIHPDYDLPEALTRDWLARQVTGEVSRQLGEILVTGPVGATPLQTAYAPGLSPAERPPVERLGMSVLCDEQFCLLELRRRQGGREYRAEATLGGGRDLAAWQRELVRMTRSLYRQRGVALVQAASPAAGNAAPDPLQAGLREMRPPG